MPQDIFNMLEKNPLVCDISNATQERSLDVADAFPLSYCLPGTSTIFLMDEDVKLLQTLYKHRKGIEMKQANQLVEQEEVQQKRSHLIAVGNDLKNESKLPEAKANITRKRKRAIVGRPPTTTEERMLGWALDSRTHIDGRRRDKFLVASVLSIRHTKIMSKLRSILLRIRFTDNVHIDGRRRDKVFYHVSTEVKCRSLIEVYRFIKENITPKELSEIKVEKELLEVSSEKQKVRRKKLLKKIEVGLFNFTTKQIIKHGQKSGQTIANGKENEKEMEQASDYLEGPSLNWTTEMKRAVEESTSDNSKSKIELASTDGSLKEIVKTDDKISEDRNELVFQKIASQDNDSDKGDEAKSTRYIGLFVNYELI